MRRKLLRRGIAVLAATVSVTGATLAVQQPANASVSCYGDYCSGQDPETTGCAADAKTVASSRVTGRIDDVMGDPGYHYEDYGTIELRWSPTCKTNWARLQLERGFWASNVVATQETGYEQRRSIAGTFGNAEAATFWTPMIYSPTLRVYAHVECRDGTCDPLVQTNWV